LNVGNDLADARAADEVSEQEQPQQTEDHAKWRKSPAPVLLRSQNIVRHRGTVPLSSNLCTHRSGQQQQVSAAARPAPGFLLLLLILCLFVA
jgi:hypothetical protein